MNLNEFIKLCHDGESETLEFKEELPKNTTELAQVLASFANCKGGIILIGVEDSGNTVGIANPDVIMQRVAGIAQKSCRPPLNVDMTRFPFGDGKYVVCVTVPSLENDLCWVEGRCYDRERPNVSANYR